MTVAIIRTGVANLASVVAAFDRLGVVAEVTTDRDFIVSASHVMLPGVGAFGAGMAALRESGVDEVLRQRIAQDKRTIAICLGLQLLCESSEETAGVVGLGIVPVAVRRFSDAHVKVPQLGWNRVEVPAGARFLASGYAYFANSFRVADGVPGALLAHADYDGKFVAAFERGNLLACQFHPELSGPWGQTLLRRWLEAS